MDTMTKKQLAEKVARLRVIIGAKEQLYQLFRQWEKSHLPDWEKLIVVGETLGAEQRRINHEINDAGLSAEADVLYVPSAPAS